MKYTLPRCALNGAHTPGSDAEKDCPILRARRRQKEKELARAEEE